MTARVISIAATKGGTGKTATAGSLAQAAAEAGKRGLIIDLDPQGSLSIWQRADLSRPGSYAAITGQRAAQDAIQRTESGIDLMAGTGNLISIRTGAGSARRLERLIKPFLSDYDLIIIDTAPTAGELQNLALFAADELIIPLESDSASLQALYQMQDIAKHVQAVKPALTVRGALITQYDGRPKINRYMLDTIRDTAAAAGIPFLGTVRQGVAVREAIAFQESLFDYAPKSKPAQDYRALYRLLMHDAQDPNT